MDEYWVSDDFVVLKIDMKNAFKSCVLAGSTG